MNEVLVVVGFQIKFPSSSTTAAAAAVDCLSKLTITLQLIFAVFLLFLILLRHIFSSFHFSQNNCKFSRKRMRRWNEIKTKLKQKFWPKKLYYTRENNILQKQALNAFRQWDQVRGCWGVWYFSSSLLVQLGNNKTQRERENKSKNSAQRTSELLLLLCLPQLCPHCWKMRNEKSTRQGNILGELWARLEK